MGAKSSTIMNVKEYGDIAYKLTTPGSPETRLEAYKAAVDVFFKDAKYDTKVTGNPIPEEVKQILKNAEDPNFSVSESQGMQMAMAMAQIGKDRVVDWEELDPAARPGNKDAQPLLDAFTMKSTIPVPDYAELDKAIADMETNSKGANDAGIHESRIQIDKFAFSEGAEFARYLTHVLQDEAQKVKQQPALGRDEMLKKINDFIKAYDEKGDKDERLTRREENEVIEGLRKESPEIFRFKGESEQKPKPEQDNPEQKRNSGPSGAMILSDVSDKITPPNTGITSSGGRSVV